MRLGRVWILACVAVAFSAAEADADILVFPFVGGTFKARTTLPLFNVEPIDPIPLSRGIILGVAGLWLSPGILGVEGELAHSPRFFEREGQPAVVSSSVTTVMANVVAAVPLSVTRESLRPYLTGGLGLLHVGVSDVINLIPVDRNLLALSLGGGAIGMVNDRVGFRFDVRQTRSVRDDQVPDGSSPARVRLSYWRATVGVTVKY